MKKILSLVLLFAIVFSVSAQAAGPARAPRISHAISFSGTTATCTASVMADNMNDAISIIAKLWHGNTCIATWREIGMHSAQLSKTKSVTRGETYKLTVDATINGVAQPTQSVSKTCP